MLFGGVARNEEPDDACDDPYSRTQPESGSPSMPGNNGGQQGRGQSCSGADTGKDTPLTRPRSLTGIHWATN